MVSPSDHSDDTTNIPPNEVIVSGLEPKMDNAPEATPDGWNGLHSYLGYDIMDKHELTDYNAGVGFYTSVWPLISKPLSGFQIGLPSIWVGPDNSDNDHIPLCPVGTYARDNWPERAPTYGDVFQTMEGGVGYWNAVHFKKVSPKFSINGTSQCYDYEIASPGWSFFQSNDPLADNEMGIAQLSNRLLIPPDALTFKGRPNGEIIGYTWLALPLSESTYLGEFVQQNGSTWAELGKNGETRFTFRETSRDEWSIYLHDQSRDIKMQLDLWQEKIYWVPSDGSPKSHLYNVMRPTNRAVKGYDAERVIFAAANTKAPTSHAPTGDNSWTMFINTANFKGPLAFYIPETWSRVADRFNSEYNIGKGLDTKLANSGAGQAAMEINTVPYFSGKDRNGTEYSKIPALSFPVDHSGRSLLVRDLKLYSKDALYNSVEKWRNGGSSVSGSFAHKGIRPKLHARDIHYSHQGKHISGANEVAKSTIFSNENAWGIQWENSSVSPAGQFPRYFRKEGSGYVAIARSDVPAETGLLDKSFESDGKGAPYIAPERGAWTNPGGQEQTYTVRLNDGSTVTYRWYRFIDQPSLQQFNFSDEKKEQLQSLIEKMHREWTIDREYMEPPTSGTLVSLDDALIVTPPAGMEYGYVPIVIRQE